jgi:hypothetical protein
MKYLVKPLTKKMLDHLRRGRTIELSETGKNVCSTDDFKGSLPGLYSRRFVNTQMVIVDGKEILSVYITQEGISFLNQYEEDARKLGNKYNVN